MKKRMGLIMAVIVIVALMTATIAYAGNGNSTQVPPQSGEGNTNWEDVKPLIAQTRSNHADIKAMRIDMKSLHHQAMARLNELRQNPEIVTQAQIEQARQLVGDLKQCRETLMSTGPNMEQQRSQYKKAVRSRSRVGLADALQKVIMIQEQRMDQFREMKQIYEQICEI